MNIGGPLELPVIDLAKTIIELSGLPGSIRHIERPVDDPRMRRPDTTLAQELLDWTPRVELREGMARTIASFRSPLAPERPAPRYGDISG